jgi:hypothetical protein
MPGLERWLLAWLKKRKRGAPPRRAPEVRTPAPRARTMPGAYGLLYTYLQDRYAESVVLTFAQIEDLMGAPLPEQARAQTAWWTDTHEDTAPHYSDSWVLSSRTATPNLLARTVLFDRLP